MIEAPQNDGREAFVRDLSTMMRQRIAGAKVADQFSDRDDKKVELMVDGMDQSFVRRTYSPRAVQDIEGSMRDNFRFEQAWNAMHSDFERSGLKIVPSFILNPERGKNEPLVVISDYVKNSKPIKHASVEAKVELATSLGNILNKSQVVLPELQMLQADMFQATEGPDGEEYIVLTDVDPLVILRWNLSGDKKRKESYHASYMNRVAGLFFDSWCLPGEHEKVFGALMESIKDTTINSDSPSGAMFDAFLTLNMMKNGIDPRSF